MAGATLAGAGAVVGVSESCAIKWVAKSGGMIPDLGQPSGRYLSLGEREEIFAGHHSGLSQAEIARRIGRHRSTVSRELRRNQTVRNPTLPPPSDGTRRPPGARPGTNRGRDRPQHERLRYRASVAHYKAEARARRPKPGKLATHGCIGGSRLIWPGTGAHARSAADYGHSFPSARRCGCPTKPSTKPSTCKDAANSAKNSPAAYAPDAPCANPAPSPGNSAANAASPHRS